MVALPVPAYFQALPTSTQPICPLLEVHFYWKVSFGARGLSVVRNSEFGSGKCIDSTGIAVGIYINCCLLYGRCPLLGVFEEVPLYIQPATKF